MKLLAIISIISLMLLLAGCSSEKAAPEQPAAGEAVTEPTAEQIESDLDTSSLDGIESDLDSLVLE